MKPNISAMLFFLSGLVYVYNVRFINVVILVASVYVLIKQYRNSTLKQDLLRIAKLDLVEKKIRKNILEFTLLALLSVPSSASWLYSLESFISAAAFIMFLMYFYVYAGLNENNVKNFLLGYVVATSIVALTYITLLLHGYNLPEMSGKYLAISVIFPYIVLYKYHPEIFNKKVKLRLFFNISFYFITGFIIFQNHSATAKVAILTSPVIFMLAKYLSLKWIKRGIAIFTLFCIIITSVMIFTLDVKAIFKRFPNMTPSFKHRLCILDNHIKKIKENPISGNGFRASRILPGEETCFFTTQEEIDGKKPLHDSSKIAIKYYGFHPHNFIFQILFEFGIFGIVVVIYLLKNLSSMLTASNESEKDALALNLTIFYALFIMYIFSYSLWETWLLANVFWIMSLIRKSSLNKALHIN